MKDGISVVGLGRLGLPLATCFAARGFDTIGVDIDGELVDSVNAGVSPIVEPGLGELISRLGGKELRATTDHSEAIEQTGITFILVSTPSEPDGGFSNKYVEAALKSLGEALGRSEKPNHIFVVSSTVIPGSTGRSFIPLLEERSGRKLNDGFNVCYNPDFVALGKVLSDFWNPDFVLVGQSEPSAGERIASVYRRMCKNDPEIVRTSIINAEIIKVSLNACITMKIGFANTVAQICEKTPGTDVTVYDRFATDNVREVFGDKIGYADSAEECISKLSVCVITTPADEFRRIDANCIDRPVKIIDCWRILDKGRLGDNIEYVPMGRGREAEEYVSTNV